VITFLRKDKAGKQLLVVCNFTPVVRSSYRIGVPEEGLYEEVFNSDKQEYGGSNVRNEGDLSAEYFHYQWKDYSLQITLPPLGLVVLRKQDINASKNGVATKVNTASIVAPTQKETSKPKGTSKSEASADNAPAAISKTAVKPKATSKIVVAAKEKGVAKSKAAPKAAASSSTKSPKK
jgi:1,4-alpha-glucan branching enzyme